MQFQDVAAFNYEWTVNVLRFYIFEVVCIERATTQEMVRSD